MSNVFVESQKYVFCSPIHNLWYTTIWRIKNCHYCTSISIYLSLFPKSGNHQLRDNRKKDHNPGL